MKSDIGERFITTLVAVAAIVFFGTPSMVAADDKAHDGHTKGAHQHKDYQSLKNPVEPTPQNLHDGRVLYKLNCAGCHGEDGRPVPAGQSLKPPAADLAGGKWKHGSTEGEIFHLVSEGSRGTAMPAWKDKLTESERWKIVTFVKSLSKTTVYACPMHPDVKSLLPDKCPKCGMYLEPVQAGKTTPPGEKGPEKKGDSSPGRSTGGHDEHVH